MNNLEILTNIFYIFVNKIYIKNKKKNIILFTKFSLS